MKMPLPVLPAVCVFRDNRDAHLARVRMVSAQEFSDVPSFSTGSHIIDVAPIEACLISFRGDAASDLNSDAARACIGLAAKECLGASDQSGSGDYDRISYGACLGGEREYWLWRLDRVLAGLSVWAERVDKTDDPAAPLNALHAMRQRWMEFRDARCLFAASEKYGGREAAIDQWACELTETASFALSMEQELRWLCDAQSSLEFDAVCAKGNGG